MAYFPSPLPPKLIQVLSVLIFEETLLFTEPMNLVFLRRRISDLHLKLKMDSLRQNVSRHFGPPSSRGPVNNPSLFSIAPPGKERPQRKKRDEEAAQAYCSVGALVNPFSSQVLKRVPSYYSSGHNVRCFCELCSPRCRDQRFHLCFMKPFTAEWLTLCLLGYEY